MVYGDIATIDETGTVTSEGGNVSRGDLPLEGNELIPLLERNYVPAPTVIARRQLGRMPCNSRRFQFLRLVSFFGDCQKVAILLPRFGFGGLSHSSSEHALDHDSGEMG